MNRKIHVDEMNSKIEENDKSTKLRSKDNFNRRHRTTDMALDIEDRVIVGQPKRNKTTPNFEPVPYRVTNIKGTNIIAKSETGHRVITRNVSSFKRIPTEAQFPAHNIPTIDSDSEDDTGSELDTGNFDQRKYNSVRRYPLRERRPREFWGT